MNQFTFYVEKTPSGMYELRQTRYKDQRQKYGGMGHPNDVCAVARDKNTLRAMVTQHNLGTVDWDSAE